MLGSATLNRSDEHHSIDDRHRVEPEGADAGLGEIGPPHQTRRAGKADHQHAWRALLERRRAGDLAGAATMRRVVRSPGGEKDARPNAKDMGPVARAPVVVLRQMYCAAKRKARGAPGQRGRHDRTRLAKSSRGP
jgi:hypothetical protein